MNKKKSLFQHPKLALFFAGIVFIIDFLSLILAVTGIRIMAYFGLLANDDWTLFPLPYFGLICLILGAFLAWILSGIPMKPVNQIIDAADKIANGDYNVRLDPKGPADIKRLGQKFNHMAQELGSVEMLRSDFVNNFSHEFKTPIASIQGFARILRERELSPQKQEEYLDIIIVESERLAALAANVLNLSRLEQQTILTDKISCNITEQIRTAIIELDQKWAEKPIEFQMECDEEVYAIGNKELLKQVWINLLDNAIKFSPDGGLIQIAVQRGTDGVETSISNQGEKLAPETARHIFDRFYQGDISHTTDGNGLGLTIVKKITELHNGQIEVDCPTDDRIEFRVRLPYNI